MTRLIHPGCLARNRLAAPTITLILIAAACGRESLPTPPFQPSLDTEVRQAIGAWGAMPIGPVPPQPPALVELGQALFFDKELSGNRDVSCATCHDPVAHLGDGLSLSVGTGGSGLGPSRVLGAGRHFTPRNAPSVLNQGLGSFYIFWDGRVSEEGFFGGPSTSGRFRTPLGDALPGGLSNVLAAQAMLPVLDRAEMRGNPGDQDRFGASNELAQIDDAAPGEVWKATMRRLLAIQAYVSKFNAAYPGTPTNALGFEHAANAIAAFEIAAFTRTNSPFDRFLARDDRAMSTEAKRGALLFFGKAQCASCHSGALMGGQGFANAGVPQFGPGRGRAAPLDFGRGEDSLMSTHYMFAFRIASLRNVELSAPYMHNGAYGTLESVVRHYTNVDSALRAYDVSSLDPALRGTLRGDNATISKLLATLDFRLRQPIRLSDVEQRELVVFLKSLTDPSARNLSSVVPASVPSGLPVR